MERDAQRAKTVKGCGGAGRPMERDREYEREKEMLREKKSLRNREGVEKR